MASISFVGSGNKTTFETVGNEPASPKSGDANFPPGSPFVQGWDGTAWKKYDRVYGHQLVDPSADGWSWYNQGPASVDTDRGGIRIEAPAAAGDLIRGYGRATGSAPWSVTAHVIPHFPAGPNEFHKAGIFIYDSVGGRAIIAGNSYGIVSVERYVNLSTWQNSEFSSGRYIDSPLWIRIVDDTTNIKIETSKDKIFWSTIYDKSRTDWLANPPDVIGAFAMSNNTTYPAACWLVSWEYQLIGA